MTKERPVLSNLVNKGTSEIEKFQNEVLRPIVKMQHQLLIASFKNYLQKRKIDLIVLPEKKKGVEYRLFLKLIIIIKT
ncbi:hypothetical protein [Polaribacter ponticola]|uniref:Uncharacterized protein n=1 Tax=Polaribacter ponticola TaxID=2978475 RepID=A0ABT5S4V3_9FLAO|nr:hypothetical protein [Polaribacter sp. MSW5]MDD7913134.1 hypothetical protein [Polaribacter sp. MSW5]